MTAAMEPTAEKLGIDCHIIAYNGAAVCARKCDGRKRVFHQPLDKDIARELYEIGHARRFQMNFYYDNVIISEDGPHLRPYIEIYRSRTGSPFRFVPSIAEYLGFAPTKFVYVVDPEIRNTLEAELQPKFRSRTTITRTDPEYLEFLDPKVDKGKSLLRLAKILKLRPAQIMAIGDGDNDASLLEASGWGVAMANAGALCRSVADATTEKDNNNDGVAEAVEKWLRVEGSA
jgi:Cof subfamily protein (haloacid dehalogenase superfamily)